MMKNIIMYFTDQQRADTCGCYGQPLSVTPYLDRMAQEGVLFQNAFSPQPVCGPCRAIFQTGRYATDIGCSINGRILPGNQKTLANYLEEFGYETAYIGKWHLATDKRKGINHETTAIPIEYRGGYTGYWRAADVLEFTSHGYDGYIFDENNRKLSFCGYRTDCITDFAIDFLKKHDANKPFFMTVSHIEPHHQNDHNHYEGPNGCRELFSDFTLPEDLRQLGGNAYEEYPDYLGQVHSLDKNLGRIITQLKQDGIYDNTVIIYVSDHGSHFRTRNNDPHLSGYDDYKRSCHDSALKVPLVIRGGPFLGGRVITEIVSTDSIAKTILSIAGIEVGSKMIGENLALLVEGKTEQRINAAFAQISESRIGRCIRTPEYLYSVYAKGVDGEYEGTDLVFEDDYLYDLRKDPYQLNNIVDLPEYNVEKLKLRALLQKWIDDSMADRYKSLSKSEV